MRRSAVLLALWLATESAATTLREAADGLVAVGTALGLGHLQDDTEYNESAAQQYSLITAENECKWAATEPEQGMFDFSSCDALATYAATNGMWFRGHNLCWGSYNPNWLEALDAAGKREALVNHIATLAPRYSNVFAWDVVNEAIADGATGVNPSFKNSTWYPDVPDFVSLAFTTAREACPTCKLFYNDYNIASSEGWSSSKADAVYTMARDLIEQGVPIDGIGMQLHISVGYNLVDGVAANMQRLADLGLEIHVTELDIACGSTWSAEVEQQQADLYGQLLQVCLDQPACTSFETWGFTDKYTWLDTTDDEPQHPLPFDEDFQPKTAVATMLAVLAAGQPA